MTFSPSFRERYTAALRSVLQKRLIRKENCGSVLPQYRKILLTEALSYSEIREPTDFFEFSDQLSGAVYLLSAIRGHPISTFLSGNGTCLMPRKKFTLLVCLLAVGSSELCLCYNEPYLTVTARATCTPAPDVRRLVKALNGTMLFLCKNKTAAIRFPCPRTDLPPDAAPDEWDYLRDPFSIPNVILSDCPTTFPPF